MLERILFGRKEIALPNTKRLSWQIRYCCQVKSSEVKSSHMKLTLSVQSKQVPL